MAENLQDRYDRAVNDGMLTADPAQLAVVPHLEMIRTALSQTPRRGLRGFFNKPDAPVRGLYLWGGVGRGKSMLMDMFAQTVTAPNRRVHFHAFMQEIHAGMHEARKDGVDDALKPVADKVAAEVRLLAFDEMQISDITDAMIVGRLFEMLMNAGVVIVTTSNRPPDDLYKDGLNRALFLPFIEQIKDKMLVHHLAAETDYRQDKLAASPVYFSPANAATKASIDSLWGDLTENQGTALTLTVKGREVVLPEFHNGVARVPFWQLCGQPLGAADYLAVAEAVRVLILEDVPSLSRSNFNEAKRFVTLIDALYEARVRLIVSAADIPDRLYLEGEGTFEFERTASRLIEMQGAEWGQ
ncbi:MAG: AFG1 family ATPase [Marinosulfonomonas sp.]|nr:AFG1 family ATPase [Marinosulfonomonas sp.]